jgi:NADPH:quinone reductase-like Zn-dependent oxidoreductase
MAELRFGLDLVHQGRVRPALDKVLPLAAAQQAHRLLAARAISGKIALLPWAA